MMKVSAIFFVAVSLVGCVSWPHEGHPPITAAGTASQGKITAGPITADQVEPANAHRIAEAIWDEMDQEQLKEQLAAPGKEAKTR